MVDEKSLPPPWYYSDTDPVYENLFYVLVCDGHVDVLRWFFHPNQVALFDETLRVVAPKALMDCSESEHLSTALEMAEIILESPIFGPVLDDDERGIIFKELLGQAMRQGSIEWLSFLIADGGDPTCNQGSRGRETTVPILINCGDNQAVLDMMLRHSAWIDKIKLWSTFGIVHIGFHRGFNMVLTPTGSHPTNTLRCNKQPATVMWRTYDHLWIMDMQTSMHAIRMELLLDARR